MVKLEKRNRDVEKLWQSVFDRSRVNGADYRGEYLPLYTWLWPTGTFFQRRLQELRARQLDDMTNSRPGDEGKELAATQAEAEPSSPAKVVLELEREGWARVTDGEVRPVEIDEKSVQAALHKGNLEKFQSALVQSGEWIRVNRNDSEQAPVAEQNKIDKSLEAKPAKVQAVRPEPVPVPVATAAPTRTVDRAAALQDVRENRENRPHNALASHDELWQLTHEKSDQAKPPEVDWQDIDEKLLWLAKPSS